MASSSSLDPHRHSDGDTGLLQVARFEVDPVSLAPTYQAGLLLVAVAMVLLPLVYLLFVALLGYGVWYHATHHYGILFGGAVKGRVFLYVAPLFAGSMALVFMVKPLFAPRGRAAPPRALEPSKQSLLYSYVETLCHSLGAPPPRRIDVDMRVNASASFRRGFGSFLEKDLVLTLGLPLVGSLTVAQLTGVLAHEFGHFTQSMAMRLTYVIGSVNRWFARVVYDRDTIDALVDRMSREIESGFGQALLWVARAMIRLSRSILWALMMIGLGVSAFLSRQMEYDADLHQARVSGSRLFGETHVRIHLVMAAWESVTHHLSRLWQDGKLVEDLVSLLHGETVRLVEEPDGLAQVQSHLLGSRTRLLDTHPATGDRIRAVERLDLPARVDIQVPASALLTGFEPLSKEMTRRFYVETLGEEPATTAKLIPAAEALRAMKEDQAGAGAIRAFFQGSDLFNTGVFPELFVNPARDLDSAWDALSDARENMARALGEVREVVEHLIRASEDRARTGLGLRLLSAGCTFSHADFGLDSNEEGVLQEARSTAITAYLQAVEARRPSLDAAEKRLQLALQLALRPEIRRSLPDREELLDRLEEVQATLTAVGRVWRRTPLLREKLGELGMLARFAEEAGTSPAFRVQVEDLWSSIREDLLAIREGIAGTAFPPLAGDADLADHVVPDLPEPGPDIWEAGAVALDRYSRLYFTIWSQLAGLAMEVERLGGLVGNEGAEGA